MGLFRKKVYSKDKWVVFDFDGTIAETSSKLVSFFNENISPKFKVPQLDNDDLEKLKNLTIFEKLKYIKIPVHKLPALIRVSRKKFKTSLVDLPMVENLANEFVKLQQDGYKLAIVSSNQKKNIKKYLADLDIPEFEKIVCDKGRSLFVKHKTLKKFMKSENIPNNHIVYIGDEGRDIAACKKVKIPCIAVAWGWDSHKRLATLTDEDMIIDKPEELTPLVKKILG